MQFKIIVAMCKNNGIGFRQTLPWNIREDLRHFSKMTKGNGNNAIVMGKNTWISIGEKLLPKRDHLILSRSLYLKKENPPTKPGVCESELCKFFESIDVLKSWCREKLYEEIWIIGGESIYKQFINDPDTTEMHITEIDECFECDTYFPDITLDDKWVKKNERILPTTQTFDLKVCTYTR